MIVYRIAGKKRIRDLEGTGAKLYGGRWNPKGFPMLYTSANSSLAILEKLVHVALDLIPADLMIAEIGIRDDVKVKKINRSLLKGDWRDFPSPDYLQEYGRDWIVTRSSLILEVPSAINPLDSNYLINPDHPDISKMEIIKTVSLKLDRRFSEKR